ncbi:MAG: 4Fe-4S dicluster domain-containing protein [Nitrospirota bacterium]
MGRFTFRAWRTAAAWTQAVLMVGLPFVRVGGESALRFDVPTIKLYFFGSVIWVSEAYFFLLVLLLFTIGVMLFTVLYGRIWCGWMCPQTILSDFSRSIERIAAWFSGHRIFRVAISHTLLAVFSAIVAVDLIAYFVSPYDLLADVRSRSVGPWTFWSWALFSTLIYLNLAFVRQRFCASVCPYARFQSAFFDQSSLTIAFDTSRSGECMGCEACVRTCPAGIDIRKGLQVECINCAECVDACSRQRDRYAKGSLVNYQRGYGDHAGQAKPRPRVLLLSLLFSTIAVLFLYQIYIRVPVDFWVVRDERQSYHQIGVQGNILNAYSLLIENRSLSPGIYQLSITGIKDADLVITQNPFRIPPNSSVSLRVYVFAKRQNLSVRTTRLRFTLTNALSKEIRIGQEAPFIYPERSDKGVDI